MLKKSALLSLFVFISACMSGRSAPDSQTSGLRQDLIHINSVAILPLGRELSSLEFDEGKVFNDLNSKFSLELGLSFVPQDKVLASLPANYKGLSSFEEVQKLGKMLQVDAVLYGSLTEYVERQGSALGVSRPAEVAFRLVLARVDSGHILWRYDFHKRDAALSENLFNLGSALRDGIKWRTGSEIINEGFTLASQDLAIKRNMQFLGE